MHCHALVCLSNQLQNPRFGCIKKHSTHNRSAPLTEHMPLPPKAKSQPKPNNNRHTNQRKALFRILFGGNIAVPTGGTPGAISLAVAINGEPVETTTMISTPTAVEQFNNISCSLFLDVIGGCCTQVSVENTGTQAISLQNANLIIERVA